MNVRYRVRLTDDERAELKALLAKGKRSARKLKRAQILLATDAGQTDEAIAENVGVGTSTVFRTKRRFVEGNLERALAEEKRPGAKRKLSSKEEALLVATACSGPPEGRRRWTLELLAGAMVALTDHEALSRETVRRRLGENELKPWRQVMWCVPEINGEYVARMEHVLDLYAEPPNPRRPLVCFDESPTQLIGEVRAPIPARPGQLQRYDSEYQRNGTVNLFVFIDPHRRWRHVKVTERRTSIDFAECMRDLVDVHYRDAEQIRVVLDNLSTHGPGALYEAFAPEEARRILRRIEFHFVPKHGSWLNMAEIEIGVLRGQCLDRRIDDGAVLRAEIAAWEAQRNDARATIEWTFTTEKAREKMGRAYPNAKPRDTDAPGSTATPATEPRGANVAVEPTVTSAPVELTVTAVEATVTNAAVEPTVTSPAVEATVTNAAVEPTVTSAPAEVIVQSPMSQPSNRGPTRPKRASTGPAARFKARPTIPSRRPERKTKAKPKKTTTAAELLAEPVKTTVQRY
jgi:transposase